MSDSFVLARLICPDVEGEDFWVAQYPSGAYTYVGCDDLKHPQAGQLILIGQQQGSIQPAPAGMQWGNDWRAVGIVRHVTDSTVIQDVGGGLRSFPVTREDLRPGDVVAVSDDEGVGERLAQEVDIALDRSDTDWKRFELESKEVQGAPFIGPDIAKQVARFVEGPIVHKREYDAIGVSAPKGVLFVGLLGQAKRCLRELLRNGPVLRSSL